MPSKHSGTRGFEAVIPISRIQAAATPHGAATADTVAIAVSLVVVSMDRLRATPAIVGYFIA